MILKSRPAAWLKANAATSVGSEECQMEFEVEFCSINDLYALCVGCVLCPAVVG